MPKVQSALVGVAHGAVVIDEQLAVSYEAAAGRSMETSDSLDEYRAQMRLWDDAEAALRTVRAALVAAQEAIRAYEAGKDKGWEIALACVLSASDSLIEAAMAIGIDTPPPLRTARDFLGPVVKGVCGGSL